MNDPYLVIVIDDDDSVRESLPDLLREFGFAVRAFASAEEFLASDSLGKGKCLILDIVMPGMSGPQLQQELILRQHEVPIIYITAHGEDALGSCPPLTGTVTCLNKPFSEASLLAAFDLALKAGRVSRLRP